MVKLLSSAKVLLFIEICKNKVYFFYFFFFAAANTAINF